MLLPVSDCLIRRLIACARYELSKEDALSHRDKMRYARKLLNEWGNVKTIFETKLNLKLESYTIFSEISDSKYREILEKSNMGYFPLIIRHKKDDLVDTLLKFEELSVRCYVDLSTNKSKVIESLIEEIESGIFKLDEENCNNIQYFTDLYYHYFIILSDILLTYDDITISNIPFWDKLLDNDLIYSEWEDSVKERYDIKQHTNRTRKFIEWRECFFKQKVSDCSNPKQEGTTNNTTCDIDYLFQYFDNKLTECSTKGVQDLFIYIHLLRAQCIIIGYKLCAIKKGSVDMSELFSSIYDTNAWNIEYLKKLKDTLLKQKQEAEDREINHLLRIEETLESMKKEHIYIFEKQEQDYIIRKMRDLIDNGFFGRNHHTTIMENLENFLTTGMCLNLNNKIEVPENKKELLYGFFFSFCDQKVKANAFATFIRGVFANVANENTLNHNWRKYKRYYCEQ